MFINTPTDNIEVSSAWDRTSGDVIAELAQHPVALIGDGQLRMNIMAAEIRLQTPGLRMAGTILPIQTREGDNLAIHRGLDEARPGDILVINAYGETSRAVFGDLLGEICIARGVAGVVIDGSTRDIDELAALKLPVYARGVTPAGPWKNGPGTVGFPVACGGVVCSPGDAIFGDSDGVIVVPRARIKATLAQTRKQDAFESTLRAQIRDTAS